MLSICPRRQSFPYDLCPLVLTQIQITCKQISTNYTNILPGDYFVHLPGRFCPHRQNFQFMSFCHPCVWGFGSNTNIRNIFWEVYKHLSRQRFFEYLYLYLMTLTVLNQPFLKKKVQATYLELFSAHWLNHIVVPTIPSVRREIRAIFTDERHMWRNVSLFWTSLPFVCPRARVPWCPPMLPTSHSLYSCVPVLMRVPWSLMCYNGSQFQPVSLFCIPQSISCPPMLPTLWHPRHSNTFVQVFFLLPRCLYTFTSYIAAIEPLATW